VKVEKQVLEQASVEPSPSSKGTAFVLHSLDGGPSITIPNSKAPYFIQYKDIGQTKPNPTAKIGQVSFLDEETVNYYPVCATAYPVVASLTHIIASWLRINLYGLTKRTSLRWRVLVSSIP
jgi:hypothetical protein